MQCRAVARRTAFGSLTVLGDLAQGTTPWAARDWREQLAHLGAPGAPVVPLTTGYRVPAVIVELTNRLLPHLGVDVPAGRSARTDGEVTAWPAEEGGLLDATAGAVAAAREGEGSVGVIAPGDLVGPLRERLAGEDRVAVLPPEVVKGLEYDHVVVVEPATIMASGPRGPHLLYVVLTRAVSRLTLVHAEALPRWLGLD
jgi:DNA helicase IV